MKFVKVTDIRLNPGDDEKKAYECAIKRVGIPKNGVKDRKILRRSIDARKKNDIHRVYSVGLLVDANLKTKKGVEVYDKEEKYSPSVKGTKVLSSRPVVVGFGPAGMFCALLLAECGYKPIIVERGSMVDERAQKIENFWNGKNLDTECNVQFGEGGAGTFSDGKLNTGIKDKNGRIKFVLDTFVRFGGNPDIAYDSKPHIGTDVLKVIVKNMREYIKQMGGTFLFDTRLDSITLEGDKLKSINLSNGESINTNICVLAIGHSARDTFSMLYEKGLKMVQKPFAVGLRIEHPQKLINNAQYGESAKFFGAADYKLTYTTKEKRGVYSFCMCPGGYVLNASSERKHLSINGMSYRSRGGDNANSAIVVTITPKDFKSDHPLAGIEYQRNLERQAYALGNGNIPIQKYSDFCKGEVTKNYGSVHPSVKGKTAFCNINDILPEYVSFSIKEAIPYFGEKIKGFDLEDALLFAVESRTSSPVRILRNEEFQSNIRGIFPAGEGAGYAGGITSAAVDGIKIFEYIAGKYKPAM